MSSVPQALSLSDILVVLEALLAHGWGEARVVVKDHQLVTMFAECSVKTPEQVAQFPFLCYRQGGGSPR